MAVDGDLRDLGALLGGGLKQASGYKDEFIETEELGDISLAPLEAVNLTSSWFVYQQDIGTAFILGHAINGVLASSTYLLGEGGLGARTLMSSGTL